jgi:predicted RNA-binding protein with PUA-like domain
MKYWLAKSEPFKYSWTKFLEDGHTFWDGVRNYQARNNLRSMVVGDLVFFYHSNEGLEIVGIAEVIREAYPDPTIDDDRWVAIDLKPIAQLDNPVTLAQIKSDPLLMNMILVKQMRLSVTPVSEEEADRIMVMGNPRSL